MTHPASEHDPVARLRARRRTGVPRVQALAANDCGPAALAMVLAFHGRHVSLSELRHELDPSRGGVNAAALLEVARAHGLEGRGIKLEEAEELEYVPVPAILHWRFNHFVVLERVQRRGVRIMDPTFGRRHVPWSQLERDFTGVVLELRPGDGFAADPGGAPGGALPQVLRLLARTGVTPRLVVSSLMLRVFGLAVPMLTGLVVDRVVPSHDLDLMTLLTIALAGMVVVQLLTSLVRGFLLVQLRASLDLHLTLGFMNRLVALPYEFFQRRHAGDLIARANSTAEIRDVLSSTTISTLLDGVFAIVYAAVVLALSLPLGALVVALGAAQLVVFSLARRRYRELSANYLEQHALAQSYLVEIVEGIETLKLAGAEHRAVESWSNRFIDSANTVIERGRLTVLVDATRDFLQVCSPLVVLGIGALRVLDGSLTLGSMLAINAIAAALFAPLSALVTSALQLQELASHFERLDDVSRAPVEPAGGRAGAGRRLRGEVRVDHVSFRYSLREADVLHDVSFDVPARSFTAIVGSTGSGKSTLASLLAGLRVPTEGELTFDGDTRETLGPRRLREQLGVVPQKPYVFGVSLRANISLLDAAVPLHQIIEAARLACIHDDVMSMPMRYDTHPGGEGSSLSGGQRQRVALARALVRRPPLLVLDEATSALDTATEHRVMQNLRTLDCTRIVIAHRLSTIVDADQIIVLDAGRVVGRGRHAALLQECPAYQRLFRHQPSATQQEDVE